MGGKWGGVRLGGGGRKMSAKNIQKYQNSRNNKHSLEHHFQPLPLHQPLLSNIFIYSPHYCELVQNLRLNFNLRASAQNSTCPTADRLLERELVQCHQGRLIIPRGRTHRYLQGTERRNQIEEKEGGKKTKEDCQKRKTKNKCCQP